MYDGIFPVYEIGCREIIHTCLYILISQLVSESLQELTQNFIC